MVVTATSDKYADSFGFTEQEVFAAMDEIGLTDKEKVKNGMMDFHLGKRRISIIHGQLSIIWIQENSILIGRIPVVIV